MKINMKKIEGLEKDLATIAEKIYLLNLHGRRFIPLPPKILIRVLPKEQMTAGGLYLPGSVQNKPMYEGIVLATYRPYDEERNYKDEETGVMKGGMIIHHECPVKPGQRIAFPHHVGLPLKDYLDDKYYRVIPDFEVQAIIDYEGEAEVAKQISKLSEKFYSVTTSGGPRNNNAPDWQPPASSSMFTS